MNSQQFNRRLFGMRLEEIRRRRKMRQSDLAEKVGIDRTQIANIEAGRSSTSIDRLLKFAKALKVTPGSLLKGLEAD